MNHRIYFAMLLLAFIPNIAAAQQFPTELVPAESFERYGQDMELASESAVGARFEVTRTEVQSSDLPAPYDLDQWVTREVASMLDDPKSLRMIIDEKRPNYRWRVRGLASGERRPPMDSLLALKPYQMQEEHAPHDHNKSKGNRYDNKPSPEFVIIDLAESEHLGMVPGTWRP